jgi:adenylate cyclase
MKRVERELNERYLQEGFSPYPLLTRIGINTGNMVVGNMGTQQKMDYTIMGNAVNLAARLEGVNKQYGTWILASEDTIKETNEKVITRKLDRVRVVGINEPVRLHNIVEMADTISAKDAQTVKLFHSALELFESRDWLGAKKGFEDTLNYNAEDEPAKIYLERCENYIVAPPEKDWDGVYNLTQK